MTSSLPDDADQQRRNDYESFAEAYAAKNDSTLPNAFYERPAMLDLLGGISGRRALDAGCGPGALTAEMADAVRSSPGSMSVCDGRIRSPAPRRAGAKADGDQRPSQGQDPIEASREDDQ